MIDDNAPAQRLRDLWSDNRDAPSGWKPDTAETQPSLTPVKDIYVDNLDNGATEEDLTELFERVGKVTSVTIPKDYLTGHNRGYAFQQMDQMEALVRLLAHGSGRQLVYGNLAREVHVSVDTVRRWVAALCDFHLGFLVRPWFRNLSRSLRKEPKWYLRDWADIEDTGAKAETFVACHLLKAVDGWNDMGLGRFDLGYLHDKEKREVDFVVARDGKPWFLVEVKHREESLSPALRFYQEQLSAPFAFQAAVNADYVHADCFAAPRRPLAAPARTLLSQLL